MKIKMSASGAVLALIALIWQPALAQYKNAYTTVNSVDTSDVKSNGIHPQIIERLYRLETKQGISAMGEQRND